MKKNKWMLVMFAICLLITSGCTAFPAESNDSSVFGGTEANPTNPSTTTTVAQSDNADMPQEYLDRVNDGWSVPTNADLLGTAWGWGDYQDDLGYRSKLVAFNEWTVDVVWHDGMDENAHTYPDAAYELRYEDGVAVLEIDFREMAGKLSYYLLLSPERDAVYTLEILSDGNTDMQPASAVLSKKKTANRMELIGKWDRIKMMIEGEEDETEPNMCTIEIKNDAKNALTISYTSREFPQKNYSDKELVFSLGALPVYTNCGNDVWYADVDYEGEFSTTYAITLLADGTLLLQNYFTMDGAPMVSYEWFKRVS